MDDVFDVIVLGTGLSESIVAAALARAGFKVAHIDPNPYYGADEATLTLDELVRWAETHSAHATPDAPVTYRVDALLPHLPPHPKQYSISLSPSVLPSVGPFIASVVASGVARYGSYKLLGPMAMYRDGAFQSVPQSKESIFQDRSIPLLEKRRLMRFLTFASGDFETQPELQGNEATPFDRFLGETFHLSHDLSQVILFSLAGGHVCGEPTLPALHRMRRVLKSAGRYGASPFLVSYYGGSGEIAQGFCRAAAVNGAAYILGRKIAHFVVDDTQASRFAITLEDIPDSLRSSCVLSSMACVPYSWRSRVNVLRAGADVSGAHHSPVHAVARCIAVVDGTVTLPRSHGGEDVAPVEGQSDSYLVVFPPGSLEGGSATSSVTLLTAGAGTLSAPQGKNILYLSMPLTEQGGSSQELLRPYLDRILELNSNCQAIFQLFYMQYFTPGAVQPPTEDVISHLVALPPLWPDIFQSVDQAANDAEAAFWSVSKMVDPQKVVEWWMNNHADNDDEQEME